MAHSLLMATNTAKTDKNEIIEPFDKILQTLITSVSSSLETSFKTQSGYPRNNRDSKNQDGMESLNNRDNVQTAPSKSYPNFWPQALSPIVVVPEPSRDESGGENFAVTTKKNDSAQRKFRSKSANTRSGNKTKPKTAKLKKSREQEPSQKDWMTVLEERSKGEMTRIIKPNEFEEEKEERNYKSVIIPSDGDHDDDGSSSFTTEDFPPRSIFTAGSSDATSIGWADDAIESESTDILARQWAQVEQVFHFDNEGVKPEEMSDVVYQEVLLWRNAFNTKSSTRNFNFKQNAAKMSMSLHNKDDDKYPSNSNLSPSQHHNHNHPIVRNFTATFPIATSTPLPTEFEQSNKRSPQDDSQSISYSLQRQTSAFTSNLHRENLGLDLRLPTTFSGEGGPSFVQSWLENLTTDFPQINNQDRDAHQEEQPFSPSLPTTKFDIEVFNDDDDDERGRESPDHFMSQRRSVGFKVQRPISSQYLNRTLANREEIKGNGIMDNRGPKLSMDSNQDLNSMGDLNSAYFNEKRNNFSNSGAFRPYANDLTSSPLKKMMTPNQQQLYRPRKQSGWSRHTHFEDDDFLDRTTPNTTTASEQDDAGNKSRKNFISWLLFDENDENLAQDGKQFGVDS